MPLTTFQVSCILFVRHTLLLEPYQIDRLSFSISKDSWERPVARRPRCSSEPPWSFSSPEPLGFICNRPVALDATENTNFFIGWRQLNAQSKLKIKSTAHNILLRALSTWKHKIRVWDSLIAKILFCLYAIAVKKRIAGKVWEVSTKTTSLDKESIAFVVR